MSNDNPHDEFTKAAAMYRDVMALKATNAIMHKALYVIIGDLLTILERAKEIDTMTARDIKGCIDIAGGALETFNPDDPFPKSDALDAKNPKGKAN